MVQAEDDGKTQLYAFGHGQMADRVLMLWVGEDDWRIEYTDFPSPFAFC